MESKTLRGLIDSVDTEGIRNWLNDHPEDLDAGLPFDSVNPVTAHPLHRICDGVFSGQYSGTEAEAMALVFLEKGSDVNGDVYEIRKDTPLIAAASLGADEVALLLIDRGADIRHKGTHGGTALHWASWCGRDKLVEKLLGKGAEVNELCLDFRSTPLFWAVHGYVHGGTNRNEQVKCAQLLLTARADPGMANIEGIIPVQLLTQTDDAMAILIRKYSA